MAKGLLVVVLLANPQATAQTAESQQPPNGQEGAGSSLAQRRVYQPPKLIPIKGKRSGSSSSWQQTGPASHEEAAGEANAARADSATTADYTATGRVDDLVPAVVTVAYSQQENPAAAAGAAGADAAAPQAVQGGQPRLLPPQPMPLLHPSAGGQAHEHYHIGSQPLAAISGLPSSRGVGCDSWGGACDAGGCDAGGCDAGGCGYRPFRGLLDDFIWGNSACGGCDSPGVCGGGCRMGLLSPHFFQSQRWFASAEWMMWFRQGQNLPALAVDGGGQALFGGGGRLGENGESGARFTVGMWLDPRKNQSLVGRMWGAGEESFGFTATRATQANVAIPFTDETGVPGVFQIIDNAPVGANEFLNINFQSEAYGADLSLRQCLASGLGGRVDFMYGYQFFRLNESLTMRSQAVSLVPAPQTTTSIIDTFDVSNEFHGGNVGLAMHYRELRWSFNGLCKVGIGALNRNADLRFAGTDAVQGGGVTPTGEGYLVNAANAGSSNDSTFAVIPEISLGLGYQLNRYTDFTFGYNYLMVSDVLQVDGAINTTVDITNNPPTAPVRNFSYGDYWMHGVHVGVNFNY